MIEDRYVLFTRIAIFRAADGSYSAGPLWAYDLKRHFEYIRDFHICCPVEEAENAPEDAVVVPQLTDANVIALRRDGGWGSVLANLWPNYRQVKRAVAPGGIMHSSGAGWAFPLSYYLLRLKKRYEFRWLMVIESTFWMLPKEGRHGLRKRLAEKLHRSLIRRCLARADARIFTQDWYRETLYGGSEACLVAPATWIAEDAILDAPPGPRAPGPARLVFPSRLIPEKGVATVLDAVTAYEALPDAPPLVLDIVGAGEMSDTIDRAIAGHAGRVTLGRKPMQAYGAPFFDFLRGYDAVIVANRTEEQPRLIFDAFSQAVPCLVSATSGNLSVLQPGTNGWTFPPGDADALAAQMARIAADPGALAPMQTAALDQARRFTHVQMHRRREKFLDAVFGDEA